MLMVGVATCSAASTSACWRIASTSTYVHVPVTFFHSNRSQRLEVFRTYLSYKGCPYRLKASDARLEFETASCYFDSFLFTSPSVNCPHGCCGEEVITKKLSDHKIFITKIYIHVIFSNFTKILNHENLELYGN